MIPKIIHCFWAGGPKTRLAKKCLASWKTFAPDYEIREWTLADLPVAQLPAFCQEAIRRKRWAFASDVIRMHALKECGGIYLDCDVELVRPIAELPAGEWVAGEWTVSGKVGANPGSGIALEKDSPVAQDVLDHYARTPYNEHQTAGEVMGHVMISSEL